VTEPSALDPAQSGLGDMDAESLRRHGHAVIDWIVDYLDSIDRRPVLSRSAPGEVRGRFPAEPPASPAAFGDILSDLDRSVLPGITHWNHPSFHGYFAITGAGPGILGEALTAALNVNGMLWRTSPSATELELLVVDWLRQLLGMSAAWSGLLTDGASTSTMLALAAARERTGLDVRQRGLSGRPDLPPLRVYASEHAHSSVEKAAIVLGLGRDGVRPIAVDDGFRLRPDALATAIEEDVRFGHRPLAIVATVGTTATTSVDPLDAIAEVRDAAVRELGHPIWLHVDGAYGAALAICEEHRHLLEGIERADSLVINPHKWLFTPIDCSVLLLRDPATLATAFSLVPDYLATDDGDVIDLMDYGVALGRRFRALKLWMTLRYFGADGLRRRLAEHVQQAARVAAWVDAHDELELVLRPEMSTVVFRLRPSRAAGANDVGTADAAETADDRSRRVLRWLDADGRILLSGTVLEGRHVLRLALGNLRTTEAHLDRAFTAIDDALAAVPPR
jgi:aromatic-L-amino-acid/L-tryptophan decarboxylase